MAEEAAPTGQDPVQTTQQPAPVAPAPPQPQVNPGPWEQDIRSSFTDPQVAAQVDAFMRSHVQPRVTQLEQQVASTTDAQQLYQALQEDPESTYIEISRAMYGDDYANALAQQVQAAAAGAPAQQYQDPTQQYQQPAQPYQDPRIEELLAEREAEQQAKAYEEAKAQFLQDPQYADIKSHLFDPFVGAADSWDEAVELYRAYMADAAQANGQQPPPPEEAPPVAVGGTSDVPIQQKQSLHEAIDDWNNSRGTNPPPPVMG